MMHLTRFAGILALLGLAGVPVLAHAENRRAEEPVGGAAPRGKPDPYAPPPAPFVSQFAVQPPSQSALEATAVKLRGRLTPQERRRLREDVSDASRSLDPPDKHGGLHHVGKNE